MQSVTAFKKKILDHYWIYGRKVPWRETTDPYRILVSEVMLQQTQVPRVIEKYEEFIRAFPSFRSLARASIADVLSLWQGLGYNRRALYLKKAAEAVVEKYGGRLPHDPGVLETLPGIGYATACSICAFAFNKPVVFIETNIRSVFIHFFFRNRKKVSDDELLPLIEKALDRNNPRAWYWALMDYGSMLKKDHNPSRKSKHHVKQSKFEGSDRQLRGKIVKLLVRHSGLPEHILLKELKMKNKKRFKKILLHLEKDGLVINKNKSWRLT